MQRLIMVIFLTFFFITQIKSIIIRITYISISPVSSNNSCDFDKSSICRLIFKVMGSTKSLKVKHDR